MEIQSYLIQGVICGVELCQKWRAKHKYKTERAKILKWDALIWKFNGSVFHHFGETWHFWLCQQIQSCTDSCVVLWPRSQRISRGEWHTRMAPPASAIWRHGGPQQTRIKLTKWSEWKIICQSWLKTKFHQVAWVVFCQRT